VVDSDEKETERARRLHPRLASGTAALVEPVHERREIYVGILGTQTLRALRCGKLFFTKCPTAPSGSLTDPSEVERQVSEEVRIDSGPAKRDLPAGRRGATIPALCKRAYRAASS